MESLRHEDEDEDGAVMGGVGSGRDAEGKPRRKAVTQPRHRGGRSESKYAWNQARKILRSEAAAKGICPVCLVRPAHDAGHLNITYKLCQECRSAIYARKAERPVPEGPPVDFCLDCLGANFHRDDCPKMDTLISLDVRIERVLQGGLARRLAPPSHDRPVPHARKELTPDSMEDGRSRDEGLPEFGWGETAFPVPTGVTLIPPTPSQGD